MPAMLLQPILENCFKHGMKAQASLHIRLQADLEQDILKVVVHDTGEGFEPGEAVGGPASHIGLNNVSSRLSLRYKRDDLFSIESKKHAFTTVTLRIPQEEECI
jgi:sensor histidine kinase YesM